jgi:beta-lactamase regulating signal transducer with metallopeptidase domain
MMSIVEFFSQPVWHRLSVTLVHFLWQGLTVAVIAYAAVRVLRLKHGNPRYGAYLLAFAVMTVSPLLTFTILGVPAGPATLAPGPVPQIESPGLTPRFASPEPAQPRSESGLTVSTTHHVPLRERLDAALQASLPWALVGWMGGVLILSVRLLLGFLGVRRWRRDLKPLADSLESRVALLSERLGLPGFSRVFISRRAMEVVALGYLRPMVLLPATVVTQMPPEMLEAVIAHELAHIRRLDLWANLAQRVVETLLFYHPAVWWLSHRLRAERELCCDELAVKATGERLTYASALESAGRTRLAARQRALAMELRQSKKSTLARVRHVLGLPPLAGDSGCWYAGAIGVLLVVALLLPPALVFANRPAETRNPSPQDLSQNQVTCKGIVVDQQRRPVGGARIKFYEAVYVPEDSLAYPKLLEETVADESGRFSFTTKRVYPGDGWRHATIVVTKPGLAIGWASWERGSDWEFVVRLDSPRELTGIVVDEKGEPVSGADVSLNALVRGKCDIYGDHWLMARYAPEISATKTDSVGRFRFSRLPADSRAELLVTKTGSAAVLAGTVADESRQLRPGQEGIRIELPPEGIIEGIVVEKGSGRPIPGVQLSFDNDRMTPLYLGRKPTIAGPDGRFRIEALAPGPYTLEITCPSSMPCDWLAAPLVVPVTAGQVTRDVRIELGKGGVLEATVVDDATGEPIEGASVNLGFVGIVSVLPRVGRTDKNGIVRIRAIPRTYQVTVSKEGQELAGRRWASIIDIREGETARGTWSLTIKPDTAGAIRDATKAEVAGVIRDATGSEVTGVIRDAAGKPVEGVQAKVATSRPWNEPWTRTDLEGRFRTPWHPSRPTYVVARDKRRNLAAITEFADNANPIDVGLKPGVVLAGEVVDPNGKAISHADVQVQVELSPQGAYSDVEMTTTDERGRFSVNSLFAGHRHAVTLTAEGYGTREVDVKPADIAGGQFDLGSVVLPVPKYSLSGLVVTADGQPLEGAEVSVRESVYRETRTDREGRFSMAHLCEGQIEVSAYASRGDAWLLGRVETEAGTRDVKIVASPRPSSPAGYLFQRHPSLVGKPLPDLKDLLGTKLSSADIDGKRIVVCFFDMKQRASRQFISELAKRAKELKEEGIVAVAVQAPKVDEKSLNEWVQKLSLPFATGMVQDDTGNTRFTWGVRSLPWLIFTDRKHIALAEGFDLDKLDREIRAINESTPERR